jgi:hypothetical protein
VSSNSVQYSSPNSPHQSTQTPTPTSIQLNQINSDSPLPQMKALDSQSTLQWHCLQIHRPVPWPHSSLGRKNERNESERYASPGLAVWPASANLLLLKRAPSRWGSAHISSKGRICSEAGATAGGGCGGGGGGGGGGEGKHRLSAAS